MIPRLDISGKKFGEWTAIRYIGKKYWECQCSCGEISNVDGSKLRNGKSNKCRSCGQRKCKDKDYGSRLYVIWNNMKQRCYNTKSKAYQWYGSKGITVCNEWLKNYENFKQWALENNYSDSLTIDRINNNEGYSKDNCRWISLSDNIKKSQSERELSILNSSGKKNISWNNYKNKYDLIINKTYVGSYHTIESAIIDRDWFINQGKERIEKENL